MQKQKQLSKKILALSLAAAMLAGTPVYAQEIKEQNTGLYRDVFDQNLYYEGTQLLRLNRLYRVLFGKKLRAGNVNVFDEVPDSEFFVNRHGKERMNAADLARGFYETDGPSGMLTVYKGKTAGLHPGFFVSDAAGVKYLLKFDSYDNLEMTTGAEAVTSRFYYAIGYHVPQYTVSEFAPDMIQAGPNAMTRDETGFKKPLTEDMLQESLMFLPRTRDGNYRVCASKILDGENKGYWSFLSRRKADSTDTVDHQDLREIRALRVFSSWVNNYDVRESNTLDMLIEENGQKKLRHYLIDFSAALGAAAKGPKPPMFSHEHMVDYGEMFKAFVSLGLWEKPWQRRWREAKEQNLIQSPAVGYFDNRYFEPEEFKLQLPYYAFKNLSLADAFWAAKIIASFTDDDIRAIVSAGKYSDSADADTIVRILSERRDIIAKYWFSKSAPLDNFEYESKALTFEDLSVTYGYENAAGTEYIFDVIGKSGDKGSEITQVVTDKPRLEIQSAWFSGAPELNILIRVKRPNQSKPSPYVLVEMNSQSLLGIMHQD